MTDEVALLNNYLILGALLVGIGIVGVLTRRNMIVMFLSAEIILQGVSLSLVAWGRFHNDFGGQMLVVFMIAVAACEAAIMLALVLVLFERRGNLDIAGWHGLREANQPRWEEENSLPPPPDDEEPLPHLSPAGIAPEIPRKELDYRPTV
jgi:NADH-quinone oxidoreductase subunit K